MNQLKKKTRYLLYASFLFCLYWSCGEDKKSMNKDCNEAMIESLQKEIYEAYADDRLIAKRLSLRLWEELNCDGADPIVRAQAAVNISGIYELEENNPDSAAWYLERALEVHIEQGDSAAYAQRLHPLGVLRVKQGKKEEGILMIEQAISYLERTDYMGGIPLLPAQNNLIKAYLMTGMSKEAEGLLRDMLGHVNVQRDIYRMQTLLADYMSVCMEMDDCPCAERAAKTAESLPYQDIMAEAIQKIIMMRSMLCSG